METGRRLLDEAVMGDSGHGLLSRTPAGHLSGGRRETIEEAWYALWDYVGETQESPYGDRNWGDGFNDGIHKVRSLMIQLHPWEEPNGSD